MPFAKKVLAIIGVIGGVYAAAYVAKETILNDPEMPIAKMKADINCGQPYLDKRYAEALEPCRQAAESGSSMAHAMLGEMYYYGRGVEQNRAVAHRHALAAADSEPQAQFLLGLILLGRNESDDIVQARDWLMKATVNCHAVAPIALSGSYARSDYKDPLNAYVWILLSKGIAARDPEYSKVIEEHRIDLEAVLAPDQISEAVSKAAAIRATFEPACRS